MNKSVRRLVISKFFLILLSKAHDRHQPATHNGALELMSCVDELTWAAE